jgi:hypothetical protein
MKNDDPEYKEQYVFSRFVILALLLFLAAILVKVIFY